MLLAFSLCSTKVVNRRSPAGDAVDDGLIVYAELTDNDVVIYFCRGRKLRAKDE